MSFLLDTDICSAFLKNHPRVVARVMLHYGSLSVSVVTVGELLIWGNRATAAMTRMRGIVDLIAACQILDIDRRVAEQFGEIRATLLDAGRPIGDMDLLNASVALVHNLIVVTHNIADYRDVPGLSIADWLLP